MGRATYEFASRNDAGGEGEAPAEPLRGPAILGSAGASPSRTLARNLVSCLSCSTQRQPKTLSRASTRLAPVIVLVLQFAFCNLQLANQTNAQPQETQPPKTQPPKTQPQKTESPKTATPLAQTMGGQQFWTDLRLFRGWRIQQNALTGHCRLLDARCRRWESGSLEECELKLQTLKQQLELAPMRGDAVIVLHGLADTRWVMSKLDTYLKKSQKYEHVFNMSYASTRASVSEHSEALGRVIANLDGIGRIDLVGYSLGAIVIRHYWGMLDDAAGGPDKRIHRVVMLGPPNKGANLAARLAKNNKLFSWIAGKSAEELGIDWAELEPQLATPTCEFGVLAGGVAGRGLDNPVIEGDDDLIVGVKETLLAGATDFMVVPYLHTEIPRKQLVWESTLRFLQHGYFNATGARRPIVKRHPRQANDTP